MQTQSSRLREQKSARNSPAVLNAMFNELQFWDGRAESRNNRSFLINPGNGMDHTVAADRVRQAPEYKAMFVSAFERSDRHRPYCPSDYFIERLQVSRQLTDRFIAGDQNAI
jgi:cytochrome c peroxidase